jgi:ATP-dependent DNA helicase RecG
MTATPIPRSWRWRTHGDMDVSVLDEKPPGGSRSAPRWSPRPAGRGGGPSAQAVAEGRQAYWVCPLVEESEVVDYASAEERFKALRATLGDRVGLVHGQMPPAEKDAAMARLWRGNQGSGRDHGDRGGGERAQCLDHGDRTGRDFRPGAASPVARPGGAGRGGIDLPADVSAAPERNRRAAACTIRDTEDGFRIAEEDLAMRGAGDLIGTAQSGLPRFRVADLERQAALMALAQSDARALLLADDPGLTGPRGQAARMLLWLMDQDRAIRLMNACPGMPDVVPVRLTLSLITASCRRCPTGQWRLFYVPGPARPSQIISGQLSPAPGRVKIWLTEKRKSLKRNDFQNCPRADKVSARVAGRKASAVASSTRRIEAWRFL